MCANLRDISVSTGNSNFKVVGVFLLDFGCVSIKRYFASVTEVTIPKTIRNLGGGCFAFCGTLATVVFESGSQLSSIESEAFYECLSLSSICIPSSVERILRYCFYGCLALSTVTFEYSSKLLYLDSSGFANCPSLSSICAPPSLEAAMGEYRARLTMIGPDETSTASG
jgi:hypothetical protein